jgi:ketosteroid isomerase-like protein
MGEATPDGTKEHAGAEEAATQSPIDQFLEAIDMLDADAAIALMTSDCRLLTTDGRRAEGIAGVRDLLAEEVAMWRSATHRITAQWHQDDVWIAEVDASYELKDWLQLKDLPRAFVVRVGTDGITDLRVYGAHERALADHDKSEHRLHIGGRWMPSL